jgi:DNA-binding LytR/AlgR family response regulator
MPTALNAEDEPLLAAALQAELATRWPELTIVASVGDGDSAVERALALQPEVCFLDIRMPGSSGLEAAQALAEDWPEGQPLPLMVFVTAYEQYALAAFEAQAVDYLVKPLDGERLAGCISRLQTRLAAREQRTAAPPETALDQTLAQLRALLGAGALPGAGMPNPTRLRVVQAQVGALVHLVPVEEVIYFEAADKYVRVVTADREHLIRTSLKELLPQLDPQDFWQVHRGTVVQARCISSARREESGKLTLSLRGRSETLSASRLYAHLFKGM